MVYLLPAGDLIISSHKKFVYNNIINKLYYKGGFNKRREEKKILPMVVPVIHPPTHLQVLHSSTLLGSYLHSHLAPALTSTHPCTHLPQLALAPALPHLHLPSHTHTYPPTLRHTYPHMHLPSCTRTYPPTLAPTLPHSHIPTHTCTCPPALAPTLLHLHIPTCTCTYPPCSHLPSTLTSTTSSSLLLSWL